MIYLLLALTQIASAATTATRLENQVLWKEWYLFTTNGAAQGYFEEVMEKRPGDKHLAVTQRWVEKEGGRTETYIGSVAADDGKLTPVAFFSERKGPKEVYKIDGRVKGGQLDMNYKPTKPKGQTVKKSAPVASDMVLSNFLPLLLARHEGGGEFKFSAVVEDARDGNFSSRAGTAEVFGKTKEIRGQSCRRTVVEFNGVDGEWWITKEGKLCDLLMPGTQQRLQLTTEADAKKALGM